MSAPLRILVTGANGQVGHELLRALTESHPARSHHPVGNEGARRAAPGGRTAEYEIIPATRSGQLDDGTHCETIDLADFDRLTATLDRIAPRLIINAAAYTAVDRAEDEPDTAQRINADAVGVLGAWAAAHGAGVVHYSTDYVFDGRAKVACREDDPTHPVSVYGRSKLAGETALRASGARYLILRTAWVYAARGRNFLLTMLRAGAAHDSLRVVDDQIGAPTPAALIARVTAQVVAQWCDDADASRDGVYNLAAAGQTSWCGFARAIFERAVRAGLLQRVPEVCAISTAGYPTAAARPAFSVLDTRRLHETFGVALPDWQAALDGVIAELAGSH